MSDLLEGLRQGFALLLAADRTTWEIIRLSLYVSGMALLCSTILGLPLGALLALRQFAGRRLLVALVYTGMGLPPVVVGLFVYLMLSRSGPLGELGWLFTPRAMIVAQTIISTPVVAGLTLAAIEGIDPALSLQLRALGASPLQVSLALLWEARVGVLVAIIAGFGAIISEVGAVMLVGGNIAGSTRVLTTAIVLETRKGDFALALALAYVLLGITFAINAAALVLQQRMSRR
ncbi:MAG: ABC transporter permease subunit [Candidatus Viridilinea halotolerans]|uniref:ABC transporter permease subunit n=1 Tax=Candidatus Viridilinea halotolerans TaxID=2491704 RepID=A0A426U596_9CHLR|nr:MAG: ABC transporter permease subunit [Candidatus Viridilinea halotolerans]